MAPVGPAASSRARNTVSLTPRLPSSFRGDSARQRRTKSRISGIQEGRAGKVWDSTTTGTTSIDPFPFPLGSSVTRFLRAVPGRQTWPVCTSRISRVRTHHPTSAARAMPDMDRTNGA